MKGKLYVVSLPIGNLLDLSPRAEKALQDADIVAAEDTRVFQTLSQAKNLSVKKILSHHEHNERQSALGLIDLLKAGKSVALVSDAGTPGIADPSHHLVSLCYEFKIPICPIPGPSSVTAALSVCPIGGSAHTFVGFAPSKSNARRKLFKELSLLDHRFVVFESPHRLKDHLQDALDTLGDTHVFIAREMTKTFEECAFGPISQHLADYSSKAPKGEFVLVYAPTPKALESEDFDQWLEARVKEGQATSEILKQSASRTKMKRKSLYTKILNLKKK